MWARWQQVMDRFLGRGASLPTLDLLVANARAEAPVEDQLEWLIDVIQWIRRPTAASPEPPGEEKFSKSIPVLRLKRLLDVLDRSPADKKKVSRVLQRIIGETHMLDLFCETGLPRRVGMLGEITQRILERWLPATMDSVQLGRFFERAFHDPQDVQWIESVSVELLGRLDELYRFAPSTGAVIQPPFEDELEDALRYLAAQMSAVGSSASIRKLASSARVQDSPFFNLPGAVAALLQRGSAGGGEVDPQQLASVRLDLDRCFRHLAVLRQSLQVRGISTEIVHQLMFLEAALSRFEQCLGWAFDSVQGYEKWRSMVVVLLKDHMERREIVGLVRSRCSLLAQRLVERNANVGEHYIARDRAETKALFKSAAGGGVVTAFTSAFKTMIVTSHFAPLMEGLMASLNYAVSFVGIQLAGFTLATKQPANTAPALAARMHRIQDPRRLEALLHEILSLIRSQGWAIVGNVLLVIPMMVLLDLGLGALRGATLMAPAKATAMIQSLSVLGPSGFYAALTGVLLFCSSILGAWLDNAYAYHQVARGLSTDRRFLRVLGVTRAQRWAVFGQRWVGPVASNVSLALMLGLLPALGHFSGFPLDVRHVTLASGMLAQATCSLGSSVMSSSPFWLAVAGILLIGILNVTVSFSLALWVAIRARQIVAPERRVLYRALARKLKQDPVLLFRPPHESAPGGRIPANRERIGLHHAGERPEIQTVLPTDP